ncbi:uncharacterized protein UTRI_05968 [Ustilago trichophora]|uniref:RNase H type-1 domain-containing protein n=1 Tax=Ustilago trichophora TaxID=86804 RepID=A0A5C3ELN2_9BASI|nr:uncharacterized protein UTRI_05968 [Ustilago trichophora]
MLCVLQLNHSNSIEWLQLALQAVKIEFGDIDVLLLQESILLPEWEMRGWTIMYSHPTAAQQTTQDRYVQRHWHDVVIATRLGLEHRQVPLGKNHSVCAVNIGIPTSQMRFINLYLRQPTFGSSRARRGESPSQVLSLVSELMNATDTPPCIITRDFNAPGGFWSAHRKESNARVDTTEGWVVSEGIHLATPQGLTTFTCTNYAETLGLTFYQDGINISAPCIPTAWTVTDHQPLHFTVTPQQPIRQPDTRALPTLQQWRYSDHNALLWHLSTSLDHHPCREDATAEWQQLLDAVSEAVLSSVKHSRAQQVWPNTKCTWNDCKYKAIQRRFRKVLWQERVKSTADSLGNLVTSKHWQAWRGIRQFEYRGTSTTQTRVDGLKRPDGSIVAAREEVEATFLAQFFPSTAETPPGDDVFDCITLTTVNTEVTCTKVEDALQHVALSGAAGADNFSAGLLRLCWGNPDFADRLLRLYTLCIRSATFLDQWKEAIIKVIPKPGPNRDYSLAKSFPPISLLSIPSKILDRILLGWLGHTCIPNLELHQHGSLPLHDSTTAITTLLSHARGWQEAGNHVVIATIDISGAFNQIRGGTLTHTEGVYDVAYVDGLTVCVSGSTPTVCKQKLRGWMAQLHKWMQESYLHLNKPALLLVAPLSAPAPPETTLSLPTGPITSSPSIRLLGIDINQHLCGNAHVERRLTLATEALWMLNCSICRANISIGPALQARLVSTLVDPILDYGCHILLPLSGATGGLAAAIQNYNHMTARFIFDLKPVGMSKEVGRIPCQHESSRLSMPMRWRCQRLLFTAHSLASDTAFCLRLQQTDPLTDARALHTYNHWRSVIIATSTDNALLNHRRLTQASHPDGWVVYSDGSRFNDGVGAASVVFQRQTKVTFCQWTFHPLEADIFEAELHGLHMAVISILQLVTLHHGPSSPANPPNACSLIFCDSQAALLCLRASWTRDRSPGQTITTAIRAMLAVLQRFGHDIVFHWLPGHQDVPGNKRADTLAREAALDPSTRPSSPRHLALGVIDRQVHQQVWELARHTDQAAPSVNTSLKEVSPFYSPANFDKYACRGISEACNLLCWRVGSILMGFHSGAANPNCDHFLLHCPCTTSPRRELFALLPQRKRTTPGILSGGNTPEAQSKVDTLLRAATKSLPWEQLQRPHSPPPMPPPADPRVNTARATLIAPQAPEPQPQPTSQRAWRGGAQARAHADTAHAPPSTRNTGNIMFGRSTEPLQPVASSSRDTLPPSTASSPSQTTVDKDDVDPDSIPAWLTNLFGGNISHIRSDQR